MKHSENGVVPKITKELLVRHLTRGVSGCYKGGETRWNVIRPNSSNAGAAFPEI